MEENKTTEWRREHRFELLHFDDAICGVLRTSSQAINEQWKKEYLRCLLYPNEKYREDSVVDIDIILSNPNDLRTHIEQLFSPYNTEDSLQKLSELASDSDDFSSNIPDLKKRIKYCKNPLERKKLERQLNTAYKEMKKQR